MKSTNTYEVPPVPGTILDTRDIAVNEYESVPLWYIFLG